MENTNGYTREGVQKVRAGRFDTSKFINSNVRDGQNENIGKLGNLYSGQVKLQGGEVSGRRKRRRKPQRRRRKKRMRRR